MSGFGWPDVVIAAIALVSALRGYKRGFVAELAGIIALALAIYAAFRYNGVFDDALGGVTHLGPGSSHVIAMVLFGFGVYFALGALAFVLGRFAKLPGIGIGNAVGGALVGVAKSAVAFWALLYVVLFFPLSADLRADLHRSQLVALLTEPNPQLDGELRGWMPWFIRPLVSPFFDRHRV